MDSFEHMSSVCWSPAGRPMAINGAILAEIPVWIDVQLGGIKSIFIQVQITMKFGFLQLHSPWIDRVQGKRERLWNQVSWKFLQSHESRLTEDQGWEPGTLTGGCGWTGSQGAMCFLWRMGLAVTFEKSSMQDSSDPPRQGPYNPPLWSFLTKSHCDRSVSTWGPSGKET